MTRDQASIISLLGLFLVALLACSSQKAHVENRFSELCSILQASAAVGYSDSLVAQAKVNELVPQMQQEIDTTTLALLMNRLYEDSTWRFTCNKTTLRQAIDSILGLSVTQRQEVLQALSAKRLEDAIVASMKSDLRNLVMMEEAYFADHVRYTGSVPALRYVVTEGNPLPTITVTAEGWFATMTDSRTHKTCAIFIGSVSVAPAKVEGRPECQ